MARFVQVIPCLLVAITSSLSLQVSCHHDATVGLAATRQSLGSLRYKREELRIDAYIFVHIALGRALHV